MRSYWMALEARLSLSMVYWDGGGDGESWSDPLNWDGDVLPGLGSDVVIDVAADPTVVVGQSQSVGVNSVLSRERLEFGNGSDLLLLAPSSFEGDVVAGGGFELKGPGTATFHAVLDATSVVLDDGGDLTIAPGGVFRLRGYSTIRRAVVAQGETEWGGLLTTFEGGGFVSTGALVCDTELALEVRSKSASAEFRNEGSWVKRGAGELFFSSAYPTRVYVANAGTVVVEAGRLEVGTDGTHAGSFSVEAGAELAFTGRHVFDPAVTLAGEGVLEFAADTALGCEIDVGELRIAGGTVEIYTGPETARGVTLLGGLLELCVPMSFDEIRIAGGDLGGPEDAELVGSVVWSEGALRGTGARRFAPTATVELTGTGTKSFAAEVVNETLVTWTGGSMTSASGGRLVNLGELRVDLPGGTYTLPRFENPGLVHFVRGSVRSSAPIDNPGEILLDLGAIIIEHGGVLAGAIELAGANATASFRGLDLQFPEGSTIAGSGRANFYGYQPGFEVHADVAVGRIFFDGFNTFFGDVSAGNGLDVNAGITTFAGALALGDNLPVRVRGEAHLGANDLRVSSGEIQRLSTEGLLEITGGVIWPYGELEGGGLLRVLPGATLDATENYRRELGLDIENLGTLIWPRNTVEFHGATVESFGMIVADITGIGSTEGPGAVINHGVLIKRGGSTLHIGRVSDELTFTNPGEVLIEAGDVRVSMPLDLEGTGVLLRGTWEIGGGAELWLEGPQIRVIGDATTVRVRGWGSAVVGIEGLSAVRGRLELLDDARVSMSPRNGLLVQHGAVRLGVGSDVQVSGTWAQTGSAILEIEVAGTDGPTEHGRVRASEGVWLAGRLVVVLAGGYVPEEGAGHEIVTSPLVRGEWGALALPEAQPTDKWALRFDAGSVVLMHTDIADMNLDGAVDTTDAILFLNLWASGSSVADLNGDGVVDTQDVLFWLNAWVDG